MSAEREMYLAVCQTCQKSQFDRKKGLVCSLTQEQASFDLVEGCPDYLNDPKYSRIQSAAEKRVAHAMSDDSTADFWRIFSIILMVIGFILMPIGVFLLVLSLRIGTVSLLATLIAILGLIAFTKGNSEYKKLGVRKNKNRSQRSDLIDDNLDEII